MSLQCDNLSGELQDQWSSSIRSVSIKGINRHVILNKRQHRRYRSSLLHLSVVNVIFLLRFMISAMTLILIQYKIKVIALIIILGGNVHRRASYDVTLHVLTLHVETY